MTNNNNSSSEILPKVGAKELLGIVCSLATFWLCAQTFLNLGPEIGKVLSISSELMNVIVSFAPLVCGMFIVMWGAIGDKWGRVKTILLGNIFAIIGSLLITFAAGSPVIAIVMLIAGRTLQGMSAGAVMTSGLSLINTYWEGKARARALSIFSMGTFGGMALSSVFGGVVAGTPLGWRGIFVIAAVLGAVGIILLRDIPESAPHAGSSNPIDLIGTVLLALAMVSFQQILTQGAGWGWTSVLTLTMIATCILSITIFVVYEKRAKAPLIDFKVFRNMQFTGTIIANFCVTASAGLITVSLWVLQGAGNMSTTTSGYLTLSYAVVLLAFIRVGEKMMNAKGKRLPMLLGTVLIFLSVIMLSLTNTMQDTYMVIGVIAFGVYGLGLALFATPATSSAMGSLPSDQIGVGGGMFKMASSIGSAIGIAIASTVFTMLQTSGTQVVGAFIRYSGRQSNVAVREAGSVALLILSIFVVAAFVAVWFTVEKNTAEKNTVEENTVEKKHTNR